MNRQPPRLSQAGRNVQEAFVAAIRYAIRREDQRQNHVAIAAGLGPDDMSQRMTGKVPFDTEDLGRIAAALGLSAWELLDLAAQADDLTDVVGPHR